jgi:phage terminase small subunit
MPRTAKPTALKLLQGTFQPCRGNPDEPKVQLGAPARPSWLKGEGRKEWERLVPYLTSTGVLAEQEQGTLALLCFLHGKIVQMVRHDEIPQAQIIAQYRALASSFGLTPSDRTKIHAQPKKPKNEWEELAN